MFSNGGNNIFDFEASYKNDFIRSKFQQTGEEVTGGVEFAAVNPRAVSPKFAFRRLYLLTPMATDQSQLPNPGTVCVQMSGSCGVPRQNQ